MRNSRITAPAGQPGIYHVFNRIANRAMLFDDSEKDRFVRLLEDVEKFSGVEILTFCVMTDHFHLLVLVPEREAVDDEELLRRMELIHSPKTAALRRKRWERMEKAGAKAVADSERDAFRARMYDLSQFVKTLKELCTARYNRRTGHAGTLWTGRFGSVCIARDYNALMSVASYIDFNPVKARMALSPSAYRWNCMSSRPDRIVRLVRLARGDAFDGGASGNVRHITDEECLEIYRSALDGRLANPETGRAEGRADISAPTKESLERKIKEKKPLSFIEMLHCDVALFTRAPAIGTHESLRGYVACIGGKDRRTPSPLLSGLSLATIRPLRGVIFRAA